MKTTVSIYDFREAFLSADRKENFSYEGLEVLFDYLEQYEEDCGQEIELDVIGLCCEYAEDEWFDIASNYDIDLTECEDDDDKIEAVRDYLENNTFIVGEIDGRFIYQIF